MSLEAVTDYLGHPCRFTQAKERFTPPFEEAQAMEHRAIKRIVGRLLLDLGDKLNHASNASGALRDIAESIDDADELHSLMVMFHEHELNTANVFWEFAGLVLAGFESVAVAQAEHFEPPHMQGRD